MKKHTVSIQGAGDSCARSCHFTMKVEDPALDPEIEFEAELLAALDRADETAANQGAEVLTQLVS